MKHKKGQTSISDAPTIVLLVGLTFLIMATMALVAGEYKDAISKDSFTITNETNNGTFDAVINSSGYTLASTSASGFENPSITEARGLAINSTGDPKTFVTIPSANFTLSSGGVITNATVTTYNETELDYTYDANSIAQNITADLGREIDDNTSIAGIVLTISLIGIVLTVLIGVFVGIRSRRF